ncbi:DNA polymerase III subunit gamma and tau [Clavibacter michiganensis]|uniref:DNA polymerase III subunit gamma and tau n=1 Tax=Clavibacter michiganensis TaxID=28447 RepID=UPI0013656CF6|nr:DNA polymerase III subunit gamma and tau [Clavibacter michiganensis]MDO4033164.1 DNA polymerase III subunit gamma and tau [Clavibacter michiganensis]MDO4082020.1 DNA polymerase III subunit gamma and tau [Clavibacter michiganensis]MDO4088703.1 DNA polymerase III subunit gamma and tau [Clavibacter michiganensis]MDO4097900.1 DNA polymerase III subunit gamma and tau [Clavibacter michiganensis]MWJ04232.1 DNA polymerase III subunit gamma and tau [Clavibacter michiganensis subsp. michiganensis]
MVTALYRRYRPENFAELIGQTQVTDPLRTALRTNRVNHAYLFSGPRGCGKTTSARILARCLNCAEGPTDTPCGVCPSCVELSRDGSGSLDVVEIDAASHNGVDDARDIRERAVFAPARDRYKIFILDEAHMVTPQGFNALLKIVEEPPEHVKFIFATTEPDKVIGTIRSRTHHYPFRLVPPAQMLDYVEHLSREESVQVAPGVLPLVVRAGGGSVRDTLSLLDQLIAGSEDESVEYERAVALLGYTHAALLDEVIDAVARHDAAGAFAGVDRVIQTGQDPRRFVEDLLERLRDLIIVGATSVEGAAAVLRGTPEDELERMRAQAVAFGAVELSRAADVVNAALTEMTGTTSPRLHLELLVARVLVPASDDTHRGALARVERLERRVGVADAGADPAPAAVAPVATPAPAPAAAPAPVATPAPVAAADPAPDAKPTETGTSAPAASAPDEPSSSSDTSAPPAEAPSATAPAAPVGPVTFEQLRDSWPSVVEAVEKAKRSAWLVAVTATPRALADDVLTLSFVSANDAERFKERGAPGQGVSDILRTAILDVLGIRVKFIARVEPHGGAGAPAGTPAPTGGGSASPAPEASRPAASPATSTGTRPKGGSASTTSAAVSPTASTAVTTPAASPPATKAPPARTTPAGGGWATVAIPTSDPGAAEAAAVRAPASRPERSAPAAPAVPPTAPAAAPRATAPSAPARASSVVPDAHVPDFEEPEPDEFGPAEPGWATGGASPDSAPPVARSVPAQQQQQPAAAASGTGSAPRPDTAAAAPAASPAAAPQRYGESVVRELLQATFIEEKPVERKARPTIRPTGQD